MSEDDRNARILRERARKLAARDDGAEARRFLVRVLVVSAGQESYGIPVASLRVIAEASPIAKLPALPPFVLGIATVRGELLSVLDLAELYGRGQAGTAEFFAVVESERGAIAVRVETVVGFRDLYADDIATNLESLESGRDFGSTVTKDFVSLVDVAGLLASDRILVGRSETERSHGSLP